MHQPRHLIVQLLLCFSMLSPGLASAADAQINVVDQKGNPVNEAIVEIVPSTGSPVSPAAGNTTIVDQVNKEFVPRVNVVTVGTPVSFPNKDNIHHHVYSFSEAKRFELPLYEGTPTDPVVFDKAGLVVLGCNIHDWMRGYVYVSETDKHTKTGEDGKASIQSLDAGDYQVRVWHPRLRKPKELPEYPITLSEGAPQTLTAEITLKPALRIRRAPRMGNRSYR
ncbi:MAG: hypothetical protein AAF512_04265 [Pseudomonadota bacterium]